MRPSVRRRTTAGLAALVALVALPGAVRAGSVDPSGVVESPSARAASSFLLVALFGGAVLYRHGGLVDRSIDATADRPLVSAVYGAMAHLMIAFAGVGFLTQLGRVGVEDPVVFAAGLAVLGAVVLVLGSLGFVVVGTWLTGLRGERRPWNGLLVGAAISALGWLLLPLLGGLVAWGLVVSTGIGGLTRTWVHAERTSEAEPDR